MALDLLEDEELELLDSKGIEGLSDDALERLDEPAKPVTTSPIAATEESILRLNKDITEAAVAAAKPIAAPVDEAIKRVDESFALPSIPTVKKTAEGDIHGDMFPDLIAQAAGGIASGMVDTAMEGTPGPVKRGIKDVTSGIVGLGSGIGGAMSVMGFENIGEMMAKSAQETAKNLMPPDPNIVDKIAQGLGSMAAFMVPGLGVARGTIAVATVAPRLAMFLGMSTSSILEAGVEAGDVRNRVMEKTGDPVEANVAAGRAFFANLPLIQYTNKLGLLGDHANRAARALGSFLTEGSQESGQAFISNFAANDPLMRGVVESFFIGGIVGGIAGGAVHGPVQDILQPLAVPSGAPPTQPPSGSDLPSVPLQTKPIEPASATEAPLVLIPSPEDVAKIDEAAPVIPTPAEVAAIPAEAATPSPEAKIEPEPAPSPAEIVTEPETKPVGEAKVVAAAKGDVEFKRVKEGDTVDGRKVKKDVPNTDSISASLMDYEVVGVREVPFSAFTEMGPKKVMSKLDKRTKKLASEIKKSGEIAPLIVVMDEKGPYILEGGHRFDALSALGAKSFPALVVIDNEAMQKVEVKPGEVAATPPATVDPETVAADFRMGDQTPVDFAVKQLEKAGYDTKTARTLSTVFEGFRVLGERAGIDPQVLFDRYGVNIVKGQSTGEGFSIEMLEGADTKTFLTRSGQLYLDVMGDIASAPAASAQVKGDYATLLEWIGVKGREDLTAENSAKFGAGFEAYLMEGKAPTKKLQTAFDSFKEWLGAIYKQLSALDVELTPEVRRVFDRMLATDAELAVELQTAEKALGLARTRLAEAESQAPPLSPQDAIPAARAAVVEESAHVEKAKTKAEPIAKQAKEKPGDGARVLGVKRSILEQFNESLAGTALADPEAAKKPFTFLKIPQLERFLKAGLLGPDLIPTPLAHKAIPELSRLKELMNTGYLSDITVSDPKNLTLKGFLAKAAERPSLLMTFDTGWLTDGRIMFRTMKEDAPVYATFRHLAKGNAPQLDQVIKSAEGATDQVIGVLGVHEDSKGEYPSYLLQTEGGRQVVVAAQYYNFFKNRYPDVKFYAQGEGMTLKVEVGGQMVGALMPRRTGGKYTIYSFDGTAKTVEMSKGRLEVDEKVKEIQDARKALDVARRVHRANEKEIRKLDETPGEKTAALITKIADIQKENMDLETQMAEAGKSIASLEEQVNALRAEHGITDIPVSGLVKKSRPKGGKGGGKGAASGDFAFDTPVEMGGMEHIKPFRMPEMVRLAYELMGKVPQIGKMRAEKHGHFRGVGGGEIKLNQAIFQKPEHAAKVLAHEIGHLIDYLPDHTLKRGNLLGSLRSLHSHLSGTFGTLQVTNKELRDELMAVTEYWRPYDKEASTDSYRAYRKSARELYADAISMLFNTPGTLERMAPKFYAGFFEALDAKPAVKLAFFDLQNFLNKPELEIQESRHLDRQAMYLKAEDLHALKRKEQEARETNYGEMFKQIVVEKHHKVIGMIEAAASKGEVILPSKDPRNLVEEAALSDNDNHAFLEEVEAIVRPLKDAEVTIIDLGDYLGLSRIAVGDRSDLGNFKGYDEESSKEALNYMRTRLGTERYAKLEAGIAAFREIVYKLAKEARDVGAYNSEVFDEKIEPNRGTYAAFAVQKYLEDYVAAGIKGQVGSLEDIDLPFTSTVMKMVSLNKLIAKQRSANAIRDFLLPRGEAEKAESLNPQDNLVQFREKDGKGLLKLLENGRQAAYYVDPYIAEAFKKKDAGTSMMAVRILKSVFNGYFRPLWITFNLGFQGYNNPARDYGRSRRNIFALLTKEGPLDSAQKYISTSYKVTRQYAEGAHDIFRRGTGKVAGIIPGNMTIKKMLLRYADNMGPAGLKAAVMPDGLISEMIANKSMDISFTDFNFDPDADQYTSILVRMGMLPPQQSPLFDTLSKTKILKPLVQLLEGIRFIGNVMEPTSKIAGYKILKSDTLKFLDKAIAGEQDAARKEWLRGERKKLEKGEGEYSHQLAYNIRNYVGTANFRRGGTISHITNTIFPFSTIIVQNLKADLEIATRPNTRTGFMFDMILTQVVPKVLMFMASIGLAGDDLEDYYANVSEYIKSNFIVVPLGFEYDGKGGRKSIGWRIPHDDSGRLVGAVAWKLMNTARGDPKALEQIVAFGAGQMPSLSPPLTIAAVWTAYLSGKNPYDKFRGRSIMSDKVHKAGGRYALASMVKWTANQFGLASFTTHDSSDKSGLESMLQVTPLLNRILFVTSYGKQEESMKVIAAKQAEDAALSLDRGPAAIAYTKERYILSQKFAAGEISTEERERLALLNKYYRTYLVHTKAIKQANDRGDQDKVEHYRALLDGILAKVID